MPPLVSIVIPSHNRAGPIVRALESVRAQTYRPVEIVVVDDGSTDRTADAVDAFGRTLDAGVSLRVLRQVRAGAAAARNRGMGELRGAYLKFLDSDDELESDALERQTFRLARSAAGICYGDWLDCGRGRRGHRDRRRSMGGCDDALACMLRLGWWCPDFCYLYRAEAVEAVRWDETLPAGQDLDFNLRAVESGAVVEYDGTLVGRYVHHRGPRVSAIGLMAWIVVCSRILGNARERLERSGLLTAARRAALAESLWLLASSAATRSRRVFERTIASALGVSADFVPRRWHHRLAIGAFGYERGARALDLARSLVRPAWTRGRRWR
jgi:glycosyltransferase involved in cell wall biosynthesis